MRGTICANLDYCERCCNMYYARFLSLGARQGARSTVRKNLWSELRWAVAETTKSPTLRNFWRVIILVP